MTTQPQRRKAKTPPDKRPEQDTTPEPQSAEDLARAIFGVADRKAKRNK